MARARPLLVREVNDRIPAVEHRTGPTQPEEGREGTLRDCTSGPAVLPIGHVRPERDTRGAHTSLACHQEPSPHQKPGDHGLEGRAVSQTLVSGEHAAFGRGRTHSSARGGRHNGNKVLPGGRALV